MRSPLVLFLLPAVLALHANSTTMTTASASFGGTTTCSQSDPAMASCSQTQGFDTVGSSGTSNITVTSGLLDVIVNATHMAGGGNDFPAGTSSASFAGTLIITGGTGSGTLVANFSGFDDVGGNGPLPTSPVLSLQLGTTNTNFAVPVGLPTAFDFSTPFTFGVPIVFDASISAAAQAPFLMMDAEASSNVEGKVNFTGFTLLGANGQPIGGQVSFTPEPSTSSLLGLALLLTGTAAWARRSNRRPARN